MMMDDLDIHDRPGYLTVRLNPHAPGPAMYEKAHRLVLWQLQGPPPRPNVTLRRYCAMHTCSNKMCLNPAHLVWGTYAENATGNYGRAKKERGKWITPVKLPLAIDLTTGAAAGT